MTVGRLSYDEAVESLRARLAANIEPAGDCIMWTGARVYRYGAISVPAVLFESFGIASLNKSCAVRVHRVAWFLRHGSVEPLLLHSCDNPACVNVEHLQPGTQAENMADKVARGRQPQGVATGRAKLTADQVVAIRALRASGLAQVEVAKRFGVTQSNVSRIVRFHSRRIA